MNSGMSMTQSLELPRTSTGEDPVEEQEREWIRASQQGNTAAFNQLVLRWEKAIFNLALRMMQHPAEAEEVTQEVFFAAYKAIKRFRLEARFSTWLYRIASNKCLTRLRQRPRRHHQSLDDGQSSAASSLNLSEPGRQEAGVMQRELRGKVLEALSSLPAEQRLVVELKFYRELKFEEISEALGIPTSTAKSRFYTSLNQLKKKLSRVGDLQ